jgi:DNA-binding NarL/FixJ family response regulator
MSEAKKRPIRIAIADDHAMVRDGLRRSLEYSGLEIVGGAADGLEAVALVRKLNPDILLLDLSMPTMTASKRCAIFEPTGTVTTPA